MGRKDEDTLRRTLCSLYQICGDSTHCHVPGEAIAGKAPKHERGQIWRALKKLVRQGLVYRKGGTDSYGLTREGLERAREECMEK
ncbi:MAG: hypothetical protein GSR84_00260 [Desulfurococcales archaeon]|nr:hypothetical protein [Desulfurococcales archaeon]